MLKNLEDRLDAEARGIKDLNKDNNVYVSSVIMLLTTMKDICEVRPLFFPPPACVMLTTPRLAISSEHAGQGVICGVL